MSLRVKRAVKQVRDAVSSASSGLSRDEYRQFLEELDAEAEGWNMILDEMDKEDEDTETEE